MLLTFKDLPQRKPTRFSLVPTAEILTQIAQDLELSALRKLRFEGEVRPLSGADWMLEAQLGATVVQPCRVTLEPVTTRIEEPVTRQYLADLPLPEEAETEMPDDDTIEPLPSTLDIEAVMIEALALALPAFPRAPDAGQSVTRATPPGADPLDEKAVKPFAGLAALKAQMEDTPSEENDP